MKIWYTYILHSDSIGKYYVGVTDDLQWRLERHNEGWGRFTKAGIPWRIVYYESFSTKTEALRREKDMKRKKSKKYIEYLVHQAGGRPDIKPI